jgi:hypothetical protein
LVLEGFEGVGEPLGEYADIFFEDTKHFKILFRVLLQKDANCVFDNQSCKLEAIFAFCGKCRIAIDIVVNCVAQIRVFDSILIALTLGKECEYST